MPTTLKVLQVTVGPEGWREPAAVKRLDAVCKFLLQEAVQRGCSAIFLPGGFWTVRRRADVRPRAAAIAAMAKHAGIAILGGIDLQRFSKLKATTKAVRRGRIPGFAVAADAQGQFFVGRQRSIFGSHSMIRVSKINWVARSITVKGRVITYLLCGELYNRVLRTDLARSKPDGVVVLGHWNMPRRGPSARLLSHAANCPVWISQRLEHTRSLPGYSGARNDTRYAPPEPTSTPVKGGPWVAWTVRTI